jgi:ATP-dependent RNA helicase RhlE
MLDMGFIHDVKKIIARVPAKRQTIFFSATMPSEIASLANTILNNPVRVEVTPVSSTANTIQQAVYFVDKNNKRKLLHHLLEDNAIQTALVFTRTKHGADRVTKDLNAAGIRAEAIHGNKSQNARQTALKNFKAQKTRVLVATDIAARGIDIDELSHVINFELPNVPETYVHRIGRTGRAGANGISISFCDEEEKDYLKDIHKLIAKTIPVVAEHPWPLSHAMTSRVSPPLRQPSQQRRGHSASRSKGSFSQKRNSSSAQNNHAPRNNEGASPKRSFSPNRNSGRPSSNGRSSRSSSGNRWGSESWGTENNY